MNKVVELLEEYCQWIAIGIGGIFLVWALWTYGLMQPVLVDDELTPGNVDDRVHKTVAEQLNAKIKEQRVQAAPKNIGNVLDPWKEVIAGLDKAPPTLSLTAFNGIPGTTVSKIQDDKPLDAVLVDALPVLPPAEMLPDEAIKSARALIQPTLAAGAVAPPPAAPGAIPVGAKDVSYIRGEYRIGAEDLNKAFTDKKIPAGNTTSIIGITVMRQQKQPDGTWSNPEQIKPVAESVQVQPIPMAAAGIDEINLFRGWVESVEGQTSILRPLFHTVLMGEGPWDPPQVKVVVNAEEARQERLRLNKEAADERARLRQEQLRNRAPTAPGGRRPPGGGRGPGGGG
ncbi:MAG: hypothetical protein H7144_07985, partial [Burkholderiales bacterium]|nr:hypothetical protein [Phycisphaerae bacterium]